MITREALEKISDDFGSTFAYLGPNRISNLFFPQEREGVEALIRKHVPDVEEIVFTQGDEFAQDYYHWVIEVNGGSLEDLKNLTRKA